MRISRKGKLAAASIASEADTTTKWQARYDTALDSVVQRRAVSLSFIADHIDLITNLWDVSN